MPNNVLKIQYESEGFEPNSPVANGDAELVTSWDELLDAAITIGRPNRQYVFQHGAASRYEALFRFSLVRMSLEQSGPSGTRLRRTTAVKTLDPTEKGAVNYFLGMAICRLFASKLLNAPWLLHLDVFRPQLNIQLAGRSRPDPVGEIVGGGWLTLEAKGRISNPSPDAKNKAKAQARRCWRDDGVPPTYQIGGISYFRNDVLQFFWRDPRPGRQEPPNAIRFSFADDLWRHYFEPVFDLVASEPSQFKRMLKEPYLIRFKDLDVEVGILPEVLRLLDSGNWGGAKKWCLEHLTSSRPTGYQQNGIRIVAGPSWLKPFSEFD